MEDTQDADVKNFGDLREAQLLHLTKSALTLNTLSPHVAAFLQTKKHALLNEIDHDLLKPERPAPVLSYAPRSRPVLGNSHRICSACGWAVRKNDAETPEPADDTDILHQCPMCFKRAFKVSEYHNQPLKQKPQSKPKTIPIQPPRMPRPTPAEKPNPWKGEPESKPFNKAILEREPTAKIDAKKKDPKGIKRKSLSSMLTRSKRSEAARTSNSGLTLLSLMKP